MPVDELKRECGLPVLVDGAQSVGAIPVDVGELDYYTVSRQKWLCGPELLGVRRPSRGRACRTHPEWLRPEVARARRHVRAQGRRGAIRLRLAGRRRALRGSRPRWQLCPSGGSSAPPSWQSVCRGALRDRFELVAEAARSTLVSFVPEKDGARRGCATLRRRRDRARPAEHRMAASVVWLVDERRRHRPPNRCARLAVGQRCVHVDHGPVRVFDRASAGPRRVPGLLVPPTRPQPEPAVDRGRPPPANRSERPPPPADRRTAASSPGRTQRMTSSASSASRIPPGSGASTCCSFSAPSAKSSPSRR